MSLAKESKLDKANAHLGAIVDDLRNTILEGAAAGESLDQMERHVWKEVLNIGRFAIDLFLEQQGSGDLGETLEAEGNVLRRSEAPEPRHLRTVFGTHEFTQYTYSAGSHRAIALSPISARMSLPAGRWSYFLQEISTMLTVESAYGLAARNLGFLLGGVFSANSLERCIGGMGEEAQAYVAEFPRPKPVEEGALLVASCDGKGVPLIQEKPAKVAAFESARLRPGNRRMAMLGAVYSVDRWERTAEDVIAALFRDSRDGTRDSSRPQPHAKHVSAHFSEDRPDGDETLTISAPLEAMTWIAREVGERRQPDQPLLLLMDGQPSLWESGRACLEEFENIVEILDIIHVSHYLWAAAKLFEQEEGDRMAFTRLRLGMVLRGSAAAMIRGLRRMGSQGKLRGDPLRELKRICGYLENNLPRMRYHEYPAAGYPIATGVIEGACRHLVKDRMERAGMRWTLQGAKAMLNVRAVFQSDYWDHFHEQRRRNQRKKHHPLRHLLSDYRPLGISC